MKKEKGNIGELLSSGLCLLAMTMLMLAYLNCVKVLGQKEQVGQIARKYILRMETVGHLTVEDERSLLEELTDVGVSDLSLGGTTTWQVPYGEGIVLEIRGKLEGRYVFTEKRVSTAKY